MANNTITTFENLKNLYIADVERQKARDAFFIEHGYCENWNAENKTESDNGINRYATKTRLYAYHNGKITRDQIVKFTIGRMEKQLDKECAAHLAKLERVAAAPEISFISCNVEFIRSATWGYNPHATAATNNGTTTGYASGCGYDKESAAIADAFNKNDSILKILYTMKESALERGESDESATACTGHNNAGIIGYGAGYTVFPYFEGGVGADCFWSILKKAGYTVNCHYGKHENGYNIYKAE